MRVLYVEDNPANIHLMQHISQAASGVVLEIAENGNEGVERAKKINPDLLLLDVNLPDIDGFQVYQEIKSQIGELKAPCYFVSADATESTKQKAQALGANGYITKPFDVRKMISLLRGDIPPSEMGLSDAS